MGFGGGSDAEGVEAVFEVAGALAGFVGAAEGGEEVDGGAGGAFHVGVEGAGLVVNLQGSFVVSPVFVERAELEEGFDAGDGVGSAVVLVEPVVFEALAELAVAEGCGGF
ncbi:hypothetical protein GCM10022224_094820 [Nonomuraea antimicrobica]|uniref:Uncharacterized protein n=1 Tax=Nonomuraea antimicrobica TaxID=561173 RepID=A0ABP7E724_9ACTN